MSEMKTNEADADAHLWLEGMDDPAVVGWIDSRNAETQDNLCDARFEADRETMLALLNADDRIPAIGRRGRYVYNFWQDGAHPKGIWRRTTLAEYRKEAPAWELLLDLDALAKAEGEDWVWRGCTALPPDHRLGLMALSRGGADAVTFREFDIDTKKFVPGGFELPEAKSSFSWLDEDRLLVASALGGDEFQTTSGYPRTVRLWRRGIPFAEAPVVFEGEREHMYISGWHDFDAVPPRTIFTRRLDFVEHETFTQQPSGDLRKLDIPADCHGVPSGEWLVINLRSDWDVGERRYPAGALLVIGFDGFLAGDRDFTVLFEPTAAAFLEYFALTHAAIACSVLDNVRSRVTIARRANGRWTSADVVGPVEQAVLSIQELDQDFSKGPADDGKAADEFLLFAQSALSSPSMSLVRDGAAPDLLKQSPPRFSAEGLAITQHWAVAEDGVRIPYFQIGPKNLAPDGSNATLLSGYGGFQVASQPYYALGAGKLWLERGGVHVIANIRGGGEFGPAWHKAGMREGKKRAHDDFAAVARDLIARGVTRPARLACIGGSNGGLLVGNMLTRYPELFGAIVCAVPLLDMRRYTKLTAGPSWITEYGDPDKPEDWAFLREISAYQLLRPEKRYPPILLTTSARDDRVHPGHARKMAAKLAALGHTVYFHEPRDGGHAGGADNRQLAFNVALTYAFLRHTIAPEMTGGGLRPRDETGGARLGAPAIHQFR